MIFSAVLFSFVTGCISPRYTPQTVEVSTFASDVESAEKLAMLKERADLALRQKNARFEVNDLFAYSDALLKLDDFVKAKSYLDKALQQRPWNLAYAN